MSKRIVYHGRQDATYHIPYYDMPLSERNTIRLYEPVEEEVIRRPWQDERNLCKEGKHDKWPGNWKQTLDEQMYLPVETMGNYSIHNTFKADIDRYRGNLTKSEEDRLFKLAETDDQAKAVLIQEHLGLMYKIAKMQQRKFKRVEFTEMLAAGALELTELVTKLIGKERHHRLHTIMHNAIIYAIKEIGRDGTIKVGKMKLQDMHTVQRTVKELFLEYMAAPSKEELLQKLGWGEKRYDNTYQLRNSLKVIKYDGTPSDDILQIYDENVGGMRDYNLEELTDWALENILKPKEADVIAMTYGIGEDVKSRSEIAKQVGIAASNVTKTKARAEAKLKEFYEELKITRF